MIAVHPDYIRWLREAGAFVIEPGPEMAQARGSAAPFFLDSNGRELRWVDHINPSELDRNLTVDEEENTDA